jgi:hypothetical protein
VTAVGILAAARKSLGLVGRPNYITRDYARRHGDEFLLAPWCDMSITYWARVSGNARAVLPDGDRAYTVWHAEDGRALGRWYPGTAANIKAHARPGAIVFFDWDGTDIIGRIDHVGLCELNLGDGRMQTIEGNTGDACKRRVRAANVVAGFWNPPYSKEDDVALTDADLTKIANKVYERFTHNVTEDVWAFKVGLLDPGQKIDPRTAFRQIWAYGKDGYQQTREIQVRLEALTTAVREMAAAHDGVDVDALMARIEEAIEGVTVRLDVGSGE